MNGSRHILIVDDDAEFAYMVAETVRDISDAFQVRVATDAQQAISEITEAHSAARSFDLVITDIKMPGSSGLQLVETLAEIEPETKTITMTAYHSPELAARAEQLGVNAYLIKPIAPSEFRQAVLAALPSAPMSTQASPTSAQLPAALKDVVERRLASLRAITSSTTALLADMDGAILAVDSLQADVDAAALCKPLLDAIQAVSQAMRNALHTDAPVQQSYYGTDAFSICTHRMDGSHVIVTVFGPTIREGHVWYCMREAAAELAAVLSSHAQIKTSLRDRPQEDWRLKIEQLFTDTPKGRARNRRPPRAAAPQNSILASAEQTPAHPQATADPAPSALTPDPARPSLDQIDWDAHTDRDWNPAVVETSDAFEGLSLQEAQERGLYTPQPPGTDGAKDTDRPSVDEIDWEVAVNLDWEHLVANTDQGFAGMNIEEAKKRGLIDDLEAG